MRGKPKYRHVQTSFWDDPDMLEVTPEDKYFYLFLLTNPSTKQCGVYEISIKQMEYYTGYNRETIEKLIDRFENIYNKIKYNKKTKEIAIKNWPKYNYNKSPAVQTCIEYEIENIKDISLIDFITDNNRESMDSQQELDG